ncbi:MAG: hypothetical protein JJT88_09340 [Gammaproteobacteria bacterium]|nr:hypothetical protein [Gammaproteobacteria bacterium]
MTCYDVFNGDADGICSLLQMRLAMPLEAELVTGVKRDINLLERVAPSANDEILVLDVSLDSNREALVRILATGAQVRYFDHHFAGDIPTAGNLEATIDTAADVCTALLVNRALEGRFAAWAVVAAFGDNMPASARKAAAPLGYDDGQLSQLERLGVCINYNGYGAGVEDLHFDPADLFRRLLPYADPFEVIGDREGPFAALDAGYAEDMARADAAEQLVDTPSAAAFLLPDAAWSRRVSGVWGNALANDHVDRAHAVITPSEDGSWRISIRAPDSRRSGADELCRRWPTGGGRAGAGGVNALPKDDLDAFLADFAAHWQT